MTEEGFSVRDPGAPETPPTGQERAPPAAGHAQLRCRGTRPDPTRAGVDPAAAKCGRAHSSATRSCRGRSTRSGFDGAGASASAEDTGWNATLSAPAARVQVEPSDD